MYWRNVWSDKTDRVPVSPRMNYSSVLYSGNESSPAHTFAFIKPALIICPDLFPKNFLAYLEIYNMIQDGVLVENDLTHSIQVAPFHPFFEFEGSGESIDNFTNRSPFPLFHVLREEEVSRAVDALQGDSERVWKRNIQLLEELETELGRETTKEIFSGMEADAATNEKIDAVMRRLKRTSQDDGLDGTTL